MDKLDYNQIPEVENQNDGADNTRTFFDYYHKNNAKPMLYAQPSLELGKEISALNSDFGKDRRDNNKYYDSLEPKAGDGPGIAIGSGNKYIRVDKKKATNKTQSTIEKMFMNPP